MNFRYYITDLYQGNVIGTDSFEVAKQFAESEEHFVVDSKTGQWLLSDGSSVQVNEAKAIV